MTETPDESEAYEEMVKQYSIIEDALKAITRLQGREGLLTDYIIVSAVQYFDECGTPITNTGWHINPENSVPHHRMLGLLAYATAMLQRDATEDDG